MALQKFNIPNNKARLTMRKSRAKVSKEKKIKYNYTSLYDLYKFHESWTHSEKPYKELVILMRKIGNI